MVESVEAALRDAAQARALGASIVEYRIDQLFHGGNDAAGADAAQALVERSPLPCIITCRSAAEGGHYDGDDADRIALYERLGTLPVPPRYLDIELAAYLRSANLRQKIHLAIDHPAHTRDLHSGLILSAHDFNARPANLFSIVESMRAQPVASIDKIAFRCRSLRDNLELFELLMHQSRPTIALGMGEFGLISRLLAPKFGGFLTFASLRESGATAPGQPTIDELLNLYRFNAIGRDTRVYGVIGWPLAHSKSPLVHNAGFAAAERDAVHLPLPIPPEWEHFKATLYALLDFAPLHFRGASVTIPHKEHLVRFAREDTTRKWTIDPLSNRCGAANTLLVREDGSCSISNTDAPAAIESLESHTGGPGSLKGKRIGVLGAGGVARAIAAGLVDAGATAVIFARRREQAEQLVEATAGTPGGGKAVAGVWARLCGSCCDGLVNCTPVGMAGGSDPDSSPVPDEELGNLPAGAPVLDTVYKPVETPLLKAVRRLGRTPIDGTGMFTNQAVRQMTLWLADNPGRRAITPAALSTLYRDIVNKTLEPPPSAR